MSANGAKRTWARAKINSLVPYAHRHVKNRRPPPNYQLQPIKPLRTNFYYSASASVIPGTTGTSGAAFLRLAGVGKAL